MDFGKYIPYRFVILYQWLNQSIHEQLIKNESFGLLAGDSLIVFGKSKKISEFLLG